MDLIEIGGPLQSIGNVLPSAHAIYACRAVMVDGAGRADVAGTGATDWRSVAKIPSLPDEVPGEVDGGVERVPRIIAAVRHPIGRVDHQRLVRRQIRMK
jgi:hypothetical protein